MSSAEDVTIYVKVRITLLFEKIDEIHSHLRIGVRRENKFGQPIDGFFRRFFFNLLHLFPTDTIDLLNFKDTLYRVIDENVHNPVGICEIPDTFYQQPDRPTDKQKLF